VSNLLTDLATTCSISATEWLEYLDEPSWTLEDTKRFTSILAAHGVDLIDISSGGNTTKQKISFLQSAGSQADFSATVRSHVITEGVTVKDTEAPLLVSAVGGISTGELANSILEEGKADAIFVGRYFQQNPGLVWEFARQLDVAIHNAHQIGWSFLGRGSSLRERGKKGGDDANVPKVDEKTKL
jgi:2,4-dienoyl-CoA reductase-like NADH-dependent reductase (Old Yellow Enzyme family)